MRFAPGSRLGHFEISAPLGVGGMGEVYLARDQRLLRDVALKVLPAGAVTDDRARRQLRREALALSKLSHPNIASIYDFDTDQGVDFLVMEFVEGETLARKLAGEPLVESEVTDLALQIAEALQEAHDRGIVHRDLKPGNVMVTKRGRAKVLDFGVALSAIPGGADTTSEGQAGSGALVGTLPYMAPEQLGDGEVDARADLYALGALIYEMGTGRRPFTQRHPAALTNDILNRQPDPPRSLNPALSPRLEAIALKALRKDPRARHQSAREIMAELEGRAPASGSQSQAGAVAGNLPRALNTFVGRQEEMAEAKRCLTSERLLTLIGTGGSGKTRLALEVAESVRGEYPDGAWLVELAAVSDPHLVPQAVAAVLSIKEQPGRPLVDTLAETLKARRLLLVLDNCEHVLEMAARVAEAILKSGPAPRILATSREALGIPGEVFRRVPSLSLPDMKSRSPVEALNFESVRLFTERARALAPAFALTERNTHAVAEICRRLDGIPLAIELAAARIKILQPEEIASRLNDRFHLLTSGPRRTLPRHQTLRALIDWSYNLLSEPERLLFRRLSVFVGGWSMEAAEEICGDVPGDSRSGGTEITPHDVLDLMTALVEKSLVLVEDQTAEMRCRFLETVRQYAEERLEESGEAEGLRARHGEYYVGVAERNARREVAGGMKTLEREYDNLRAALRWSRVTEGRGETGLRIATDLAGYWSVRGYPSDGRMWLNQLLRQAPDAPFEMRGRAFNWLGQLAWMEARYEESKQNYGEGLALHTKIANKTGIGVSRCGLGNVMRHTRDYAGAREAYEEALAIYRDLGDRNGIAALLNNMGALASNEKQIERAISLYEEALTLSREGGDKWGIASRIGNLAEMMTRSGRLDEAAALHKESLAIWLELGDRRSMAEGLEMFVETLSAQGRMELAARMLGAVETIREAVGCPRPPVDDEVVQQAADAARKVLGDNTFEHVWSEGRALSAEQAVAGALQDVATGVPSGPVS